MKRLILHIGTHKTGTKALQSFMKLNTELLERKTGIFYPVYPQELLKTTNAHNGKFLHCQTHFRVSGGNRARYDADGGSDLIKEQFMKQIEEHDTILLSDERIWYGITTRNSYLEKLQEIIDECGIEQTDVIVYFRRQDEYVESFWKQDVKCDVHCSRSLEDYLQENKGLLMRYLNYARGVKMLEKAFGQSHVTVRRYQKGSLVNGDIRYDFADALGFAITDEYVFPKTDDPRIPRGNVSLSNNITEIMRAVNLSPSYRDTNLQDKLFKDIRNAARTATLVSPESDRKASSLSPELRAQLLAHFEKGNASIARKYFGIEDGRLFDSLGEDLGHWTPDALSLERDLTLFFTEVIARTDARINLLQAELEESRAKIDELQAKLNKSGIRGTLRLLGKARKRVIRIAKTARRQ